MVKGTIVLIGKEDGLLSVMYGTLLESGYLVVKAKSSFELMSLYRTQTIDMVVSVVERVDAVAQRLAQELRASGTPFFLVSSGGDREDALTGLALADDYLSFPFDFEELVLRVKNILRRRVSGAAPVAETQVSEYTSEYLTVNLDSRQVFNHSDRELKLTPGEFELLATLAQANGAVINRTQLIQVIPWRGSEKNTRTVDVLVSRLRAKIEPNPKKPSLLLTVPGKGYRLALDC